MLKSLLILLAYVLIQAVGVASAVGAASIVVDIAFLLSALYVMSRDAERTAAEMGTSTWFNVMVMSWIAAVPQTVIGFYFASVGKYEAAYIDSMASTLIDAFLVTALIRLSFLHELRKMWDLVVLWTAATLAYGVTVRMTLPPLEWGWFFVGAVGLPALFVLATPRGHVKLTLEGVVNLAVNTAATVWISLNIGRSLAELHLAEETLGALAAVLATLPDFLVAFVIRFFLGRVVGEVSHRDALLTMLAAAVHDQISIPALITLTAPQAAAYFPWWINIIVSVLKLTLLDRRAFLAIGLPTSIIMLAYLIL